MALKVPIRAIPPAQIQAWVDTEAGALVRLQHPNIVPVHEAGIVDGFPYVATQLVEGLPISKHVQAAPPSLKQAIDWMVQLTEAVHWAHTQGVVHRDLKPLNVVMTQEGKPVVIDFGVSSLVTAYQPEWRSDASGTYPFMAPEQARRSPDADHRVDVFGLGAILKFLLVGKSPYEQRGSAGGAVQAAREGKVVFVDEKAGPVMRRALSRIANRALDPEPANRYQSAREMAVALRRVGARRTVFLSAAGGLVLVALVILTFSLFGRSPTAGPQAEAIAGEAAASLEVFFQRRMQADPYRALVADDVPLRTGDRIRIHGEFSEPLFGYVIGLSSGGDARRLYPAGAVQADPVSEIRVPAAGEEGLALDARAGTQTIILFGRRQPFKDIDLLVSRLGTLGSPPELLGPVLLEGDESGVSFAQRREERLLAQTRVTVKKGNLDLLLGRIAEGAVVVRVVAFPVMSLEGRQAETIKRALRRRLPGAQEKLRESAAGRGAPLPRQPRDSR